MKTTVPAILAACATLFSLAVFGADQKAGVEAGDEKFVKKAAENGMTEAKLAELGVQKATRAEVKSFAEALLSEHSALNQTLEALANRKGVQLSAVIDPTGAAKFKEFEKMSGKSFDDEFLSYMASSHRKAVISFEDALKSVKDGELKAFVNDALPKLRAHLETATRLMPPAPDIPPSPLPPF